ncbi:YggS family pyridoxal phosphate-dependent enzyme [Citricoccus sp. NPDC055426]|uniref:YggS family pyridoxal phosphate-dependent enzyme n=1 Tax=Citricoccus sp. NPDC055426 TaxID=3155536 RepID=UPI003443A4DF
MTEGMGMDDRTADLARRLEEVRVRIDRSVAAADRTDPPTLIVVTKFHPAEDVRRLAALGVQDVGENRDQEARAKAAEVDAPSGLDWHFIGQLQSNKAKYVVRYAAAVHSVDREALVSALSAAMVREQARRREAGTPPRRDLDCLIQVDLDPRPAQQRPEGIGARGGAQSDEVMALADQIADAEGLALRGLMAVAPLGLDPTLSFQRLREISATLVARHPEAGWISAGMSQDLEEAVAAGATHLRIGTDVLGPRPDVG